MIDAHINLGNIYIEMNNVGLAIQCFNAAITPQTDSEKAKKCLQKSTIRAENAKTSITIRTHGFDHTQLEAQNSITDCGDSIRFQHRKQRKQNGWSFNKTIQRTRAEHCRTCCRNGYITIKITVFISMNILTPSELLKNDFSQYQYHWSSKRSNSRVKPFFINA